MRTYVIANNYRDARWWARNHRVRDWRYLTGPESVCGLSSRPDNRLVLVEGYGRNPAALDLYTAALQRGFRAEYDATPLWKQDQS